MTESMIERAARALANARSGRRTPTSRRVRGEPMEISLAVARLDARAVIEAMREPKKEMYFAAIGNWGGVGGKLMAEALWKAMIDKVLEDD